MAKKGEKTKDPGHCDPDSAEIERHVFADIGD